MHMTVHNSFTFKKIEIELNQKLHKKETKWDTKQIN
jgi:hypothetical protein